MADPPPSRITVFGFTPSLREPLQHFLKSNFPHLLIDSPTFGWPETDPAANWIVLEVRDALQFPRELIVLGHKLIILVGDFGSASWVNATDPFPTEPEFEPPPPPMIFKTPPRFQDPENDDWAIIPFELKNFWAKVREFIIGQRVVRATSLRVSRTFGPTFWVLSVCLVLALGASLVDWGRKWHERFGK
jgi:hypothetical protein